jgi:hypothetical protein
MGLGKSRSTKRTMSPYAACFASAALVSVSKLLESTESFGFKGGDLIRGGTANVDA